jgi:putative transposase
MSTRRVEGLVKTLGIERLSKSQVSRMAKELDKEVDAFRTRPLDCGPYTYVRLDAMVEKVREDGCIQSVAVVIATAVNADGHREVLGLDVIATEDGAGWLPFLRGLVARGLHGVNLVISDAEAVADAGGDPGWVRDRPERAVLVMGNQGVLDEASQFAFRGIGLVRLAHECRRQKS